MERLIYTKHICIDCGGPRDLFLKSGRFRTRCRKCWNEYSNRVRKNHLKYYSDYANNYAKKRNKNDVFRNNHNEISNKSNKKAIAELRNSYIKNRIANCGPFNPEMVEFIEIKRALIEIHRVLHKKAEFNK